MADVHDKATRSKNMRAIATRDTAIEKRIAALLTGAGFTFVAQDRALRGRLRLSDAALTERLEEWICGAGHDAQIDTQGIRELTTTSTPYKE
ncbi:TPA: hypothetical protein ACXYQM_001220 [Klebsiella pneumoniae]